MNRISLIPSELVNTHTHFLCQSIYAEEWLINDRLSFLCRTLKGVLERMARVLIDVMLYTRFDNQLQGIQERLFNIRSISSVGNPLNICPLLKDI